MRQPGRASGSKDGLPSSAAQLTFVDNIPLLAFALVLCLGLLDVILHDRDEGGIVKFAVDNYAPGASVVSGPEDTILAQREGALPHLGS